MLPLQGITVIALEQAVAAPLATRQLADLGARVVKIERPGAGDFARGYDASVNGMASYFVWLNRSKESVTLDLKAPVAQDILRQLLAEADVFVHNLAPGAVERLGFGAARLSERLPRLIQCSISGYGESGPYAQKKAYDLLIQCETGVLSVTGTRETPTKRVTTEFTTKPKTWLDRQFLRRWKIIAGIVRAATSIRTSQPGPTLSSRGSA